MARLVAMGYCRTKSVCPTNVQHVSDQRTAEVLGPWPVHGHVDDDATDLAPAQFGKFRHECQIRIDPALDEKLDRARNVIRGNPAEILLGVEPDMRGHDRHVQLLGRAAPLVESDLFALEVSEGSDVLLHEQLEAAGVHTSKHRQRNAGIEVTNRPWCEPETKVEFATFERFRIRRAVFDEDIADISEALGSEQVLRDVKGRGAQRVLSDPAYYQRRRVLDADPDCGRLRRPLVGERPSRSKDPCGAGRGQGGEKIPASLNDLH
jgi:hypothetical protein